MQYMTTEAGMIEILREDIRRKFGMTFPKIQEGEAVGELELGERHKNPYGIPYGGVLFTLADNTAGMASISAGGNGVTIGGNVSYMRGARAAEKLVCRAKVVKPGKRVFFVDALIEDDSGLALCKFSFIFSAKGEVRA